MKTRKFVRYDGNVTGLTLEVDGKIVANITKESAIDLILRGFRGNIDDGANHFEYTEEETARIRKIIADTMDKAGMVTCSEVRRAVQKEFKFVTTASVREFMKQHNGFEYDKRAKRWFRCGSAQKESEMMPASKRKAILMGHAIKSRGKCFFCPQDCNWVIPVMIKDKAVLEVYHCGCATNHPQMKAAKRLYEDKIKDGVNTLLSDLALVDDSVPRDFS